MSGRKGRKKKRVSAQEQQRRRSQSRRDVRNNHPERAFSDMYTDLLLRATHSRSERPWRGYDSYMSRYIYTGEW